MAPKTPHEIFTPQGRKRAMRHLRWSDHGILRHYWHNFSEFAPGAFRSNHPPRDRFETYAKMGVKTVLNLRGGFAQPCYLFEVETCRDLGLTLVTVNLSARRAPQVERLIALMQAFDTIEKPFLMHCKSGADRTGMAAAIYLLRQGVPLEKARLQLSFDHLHIKRTATGILDHFLDLYEAAQAKTGVGIEDWIKTDYDPDFLTESFAQRQKSLRFWQGWR